MFPAIKHLITKSLRFALVGTSTFLFTTLLTGCDQRFGLPKGVTEESKSVETLWLVSMWSAIALGTLVFGLMIYSMIRHRRKSDELPKQIHGHNVWEFTYTALPLIAVIALFGFALKAQDVTTNLRKEPSVRVEVTGFQWNWRFKYIDENVEVVGDVQDIQDESTYPELVLPVNETAQLDLVSTDVAHSFFVPGFLTKRDLIPGVKNLINVTPDKEGRFVGHCAEFCGINHSQMNFVVVVVSRENYNAWLNTQRQKNDQVNKTSTSIGEAKEPAITTTTNKSTVTKSTVAISPSSTSYSSSTLRRDVDETPPSSVFVGPESPHSTSNPGVMP